MRLPNSTTDLQHGLKICSNDALPFWTSRMLQKALSNERDVVKNIDHGFGRKSMDIVVAPWLCNPLEAAQWPCLKTFLFICDFPIVLQIPNMDWKYVQMMHSLSEHRKCCKRRCRMKEMWSKNDHGFGRKKYGYSCGPLALQSPGGSSVAMFKNTPIHDFSIVLQIPNMDWTYVQTMRSLSVHPKSYTGRSLMIEMRSMVGRSMDIVVASYSLALQSPGGSSVAMFKSSPSHRWLPNSTTDPQRGLKICSNDAFPFWTSKMLQKALSNERDVVKQIHHGFGRKKYGYSCGSLALQSPGGSSVAMFKNIPLHMWLLNSTTDPQHGLNICSNDACPFWTPKMLQKALSDERDLVKKYIMVLVGNSMDIVVAPWLCNPLEAAQ